MCIRDSTKAKTEESNEVINTAWWKRSYGFLFPIIMQSINKEEFISERKTILGVKVTVRRATLEKPGKFHSKQVRTILNKTNSRAQKLITVQVNARKRTSFIRVLDWSLVDFIHRSTKSGCVTLFRLYRIYFSTYQHAHCKRPGRRSQVVCFEYGEKDHIMNECVANAKCFVCAEYKLTTDLGVRSHVSC